MEKYKEKLNKVNEDPEFQSFLTAEENYRKCINTDRKIAREEGHEEGHAEGLAEGLAEGRAEGLKEGLKEGQIQIAKNLKKLGMSLDIISNSCNLSIEEVEKL